MRVFPARDPFVPRVSGVELAELGFAVRVSTRVQLPDPDCMQSCRRFGEQRGVWRWAGGVEGRADRSGVRAGVITAFNGQGMVG